MAELKWRWSGERLEHDESNFDKFWLVARKTDTGCYRCAVYDGHGLCYESDGIETLELAKLRAEGFAMSNKPSRIQCSPEEQADIQYTRGTASPASVKGEPIQTGNGAIVDELKKMLHEEPIQTTIFPPKWARDIPPGKHPMDDTPHIGTPPEPDCHIYSPLRAANLLAKGSDHYKKPGAKGFSHAIEPIEYAMSNDMTGEEHSICKYIHRHRAVAASKGKAEGASCLTKLVHFAEFILAGEYGLVRDGDEWVEIGDA
mgnify:FL=1